MCGLVGVFGQIGQVQDTIFKQLLILDAIRGEHSTGILNVTINGSTNILKKMGGPSELAQYKQYDGVFRKANRVLMGHNRWATQGEVNHQNAHPFEFDTIIGAHNGTLRNKGVLPDSYRFDVDSENLYHAIDKGGLDTTIAKVNGAFSLTWYNKEEKTLNFLRNSERPMHMCLSSDNKALYWASEPWMLEAVLAKNNVTHGDIISTTTGKLYQYNIDQFDWKVGVPKPRIRDVELRKALITTVGKSSVIRNKNAFGGGNTNKKKRDFHPVGEEVEATFFGFQQGHKGIQDFLILKSEGIESTVRVYTPMGSDTWDMVRGAEDGEKFLVKLVAYVPNNTNMEHSFYRGIAASVKPVGYVGMNQKKLTRAEWRKATRHGCCCCSDPIESQEEVADWFDDESPICKKCMTSNFESVDSWLESFTGG